MSKKHPSNVTWSWTVQNMAKLPSYVAVLVLIGLFVAGEVLYGNFFTLRTISSLLNDNAYLILLAVAMTIPILTGGIDLSIGAIIALSSVIGATMANNGVSWIIVTLVMILIGTLCGLLSGTLVRYFDMQPFIATLATMYLAQGIAAMISSKPIVMERDYGLRNFAKDIMIYDGPRNQDLKISVGFFFTIAVVFVMYIVMQRTRAGRVIYTQGAPMKDSTKLMGFNPGRAISTIYLLSGTLAGIASVVFVSSVGKGQNILGQGWELNAVAAAVIGGTVITGGYGYVWGSLVGALVFATSNLIIIRDGSVNPEATTIITGLLLLLFVLIQRISTTLAQRRAEKEDSDDDSASGQPRGLPPEEGPEADGVEDADEEIATVGGSTSR